MSEACCAHVADIFSLMNLVGFVRSQLYLVRGVMLMSVFSFLIQSAEASLPV